MGQVLLGIVGAVVGFVVSGPAGAVVGYGIGSAVGAMAFPPEGPNAKYVGPRLNDLKVQQSSYGVMVPIVHGTMRLAGNVIYASDIRETVTETTTEAGGGKGGPSASQTSTTYSYHVDIAVAICEGPILGISKIWADAQLIYNVTVGASLETVLSSLAGAPKFTIYTGTEMQMPSALQEAALGAGNVPAYRGIVYIECESFPLANFGNRIPSFSFEVITAGGVGGPAIVDLVTIIATPLTGNGYHGKNILPIHTEGALVGYRNGYFFKVNAGNGTEIARVNFDPSPSNVLEVFGFSVIGLAFMEIEWLAEKGSEVWACCRISVRTSAAPTYYATLGLIAFNSDLSFGKIIDVGNALHGSGGNVTPNLAFDADGKAFFIPPGGPSRVYLADVNNLQRIEETGFSSAPSHAVQVTSISGENCSMVSAPDGQVYWLERNSSNGAVYMIRPTGDGTTLQNAWLHNSASDAASGLTINTGISIKFERRSDGSYSPWYTWEEYNGGNKRHRFHRIHGFSDHYDIYGPDTSSAGIKDFEVPGDGYLYYLGSDLKWRRIAVDTGTPDASFLTSAYASSPVTHTATHPVGMPAIYNQFASGSTITIKVVEPSGRVAGIPVGLDAVVAAICERAGITASEYDVSDLVGETVRGYALSRQGAARAWLEPLQRAKFFDYVESDGKLKFILRGGNPIIDIPFADLARDGDESADVTIQRGQEAELPKRVTVKFPNPQWDYQDSSESAERQVTTSTEHATLEIPVAMLPNEAAAVAELALYEAHANANRVSWATGRKYAAYEPLDIIAVNSRHGNRYVVQAREKTESGAIIRWSGVQTEVTAFAGSTAVGGSTQTSSGEVASDGPTNMVLLDIPIYRDADSDAAFYIALGSLTGSWPGAAAMKSSDDLTFTQVGAVAITAVIGVTNTALANFSGVNVFDEHSSVEVTLSSGVISGVTRAQVLGGENHALIGDEIVQFRDATLISGNRYKLTGFLRGRRGTEGAMVAHSASERFILLSTTGTGIVRPPADTAEIGLSRYYRGVTLGKTISSSASQSFINRAASLKPLPVVYLRGFRDASENLTIKWIRRTRLDGHWRDFVDAAIGEASESYDVEIMNFTGTVVRRTITVTAPTASYSASDQITDFGSPPQTQLRVRIYQKSAVVGRGFVTEGII